MEENCYSCLSYEQAKCSEQHVIFGLSNALGDVWALALCT